MVEEHERPLSRHEMVEVPRRETGVAHESAGSLSNPPPTSACPPQIVAPIGVRPSSANENAKKPTG